MDAVDGAGGEGGVCPGGLSFSADTLVATPSGEQAIASLHIGDTVLAYDPATGKAEPELVQHVWVHHDSDLVDVGLQSSSHSAPTRTQAPASSPSRRSRGKQLVAASLALAAALAISGHAGAPAAHTSLHITPACNYISRDDPHHGQPSVADD